MTTPYLVNVDFDSSASVGVQNRKDEGGAISHYVVIKPGTVQSVAAMKANLDDRFPQLVFKIDHNAIVALTSSLSVAYQNSTVTGSF